MKVTAKTGKDGKTKKGPGPVFKEPERIPRLRALAGIPGNGKKIEKIALALASVLFPALVLSWPPLSKVRVPAALFALVLPSAAMRIYSRLAKSRRIRRLEEGLPTALLMASAYDSASLELVPESISRAEMGESSAVFGKASQLISAGYSYEYALSRTAKNAGSPLFSLAAMFLSTAYRNGVEARGTLQKISGHVAEMAGLKAELSNSMLVTKYTVLSSCALLVPLIVAILLNIMGNYPLEGGQSMRGTVMLAVQSYLIIFSVIGGMFIGLQESDFWRGISYALFCAPCALLVFAMAT